MKKVRLIKPYLDMGPGIMFKTDGETARNLIEREIAIDPMGEWTKSEPEKSEVSEPITPEKPMIESARIEPSEKAILPKAGAKRPRRFGVRRKRHAAE